MEDNNNKKKNNPEEEKEETTMIPVLTVFKKNAIIKNIFIILDNNNKNDEQILLVGRDKNCSIVLTHPSISRSHLIIRFTPSSRSLSIEDKASVHGTFVCGKKLEPGVRVDLKERDTITIGLSSRVYLLRFVKQLEDVDSLCCDETLYPFLAPPFVHDSVEDDTLEACSQGETTDPASFTDKSAAAEAVTPRESEFGDGAEMEDILTSGATVFNSDNIDDSEFHQAEVVEEASMDSHSLSDGEKQEECCQEDESFDEKEVAAVTMIPKECEFECTIQDNDRIEDGLTTGARVFNSEESTSLPIEDAIPGTKFLQIKIVREVSLSDGEEQNKCDWELNSYLTPKSRDEGYSLGKIIEDRFHIKSLNSSVPKEADLNITRKEESPTPQPVAGWFDLEIAESCVEEATDGSSNSTFDSNIWPRSGMSASASVSRARKSRFMSNMKGANIANRSMPKDHFSVLDEEETFTPKDLFSVLDEEEMFNPKKQSKQHSMSQKLHSLKANFSPSIYLAERSTSSAHEENQTPKSAQEWKRKPLECQDIMELKKKQVERVPLQSLMNSGGNHKSGNSSTSSAAKTVDGATARASICGQISNTLTKPSHISEGKRSWEMVVDTGSSPFSAGGICKSGDSSPFSAAKTLDGATAGASNCRQISIKHTKTSHISEEGKRSWDMVVVNAASLLDKESRKALQLLQGLKGTRLIIPESVIRELGSMKQQFRFFRRTSEADLTLQWIKECMENTKWWIHIQSSMVIEDDILDYALQYRRKENAGQIVLLSNDVTLKIKSMAKGLLCETVQQFRMSLVNPFSDRFMWAKSAPRGLTWSCHDDVVLWEKYSGLPSKAGLKLINSTLAMMMWF